MARKGVCEKNRDLNDAVLHALVALRDYDCAFSVQWVRSQDNPADYPSRIPMSSLRGDRLVSLVESVRRFLAGTTELV